MQTHANAHPTDISRVIHRNTHRVAGQRDGLPSVLLARFASDLSCQLGLLLCQRGHRVVAQSSMAQFAALGLGGCEDECFPCTEINFPYLGRDRVEAVLTERGPFDVVVFDMIAANPGRSGRRASDAGAPPPTDLPDAALLRDVAACARHLAHHGGAIWLLAGTDEQADGNATLGACKAFLHGLAGDPEFSRVSLNGTRIAPLQGRIEAIHFERHESLVSPRPLPRDGRDPMTLATALIELLAIEPSPTWRTDPLAAALA
ncbi:MAG: hypothetical protein KDH15_00770 [Rhodocyclaceae bacterium]|nr:hypothetical protein [Rhodocyclaceae bacterium]